MYAEERTSLASINEEELSTILKFDAMTNKSLFLENTQFQNNISQHLYTQRGRKCKESSKQSCQRLVGLLLPSVVAQCFCKNYTSHNDVTSHK